MGKTLELLKKNHGVAQRPAGAPLSDSCVMEWAMSEEQAPFIEVGPNKLLEGSPDVLNVHPPHTKQPPHPPTEVALAKSALSTQMAELRPLEVSLEPVNGVNRSGRVAADIIVYHQPAHVVSKQYAELIAKMAPTGEPAALLLTGIRPQVGTTTVLVNLGVAAALAGRRTVLVDAQLGRPGLAERFGFDPQIGLEQVIASQAILDEALVATKIGGLHVLPTCGSEAGLTREATLWLVRVLRQRFDLLLIDGPSLDEETLLPLAAACDLAYLVAPRGEQATPSRRGMRALSGSRAPLRGILHTHLA